MVNFIFCKKYPNVKEVLYLVQNFETNFKLWNYTKQIANATYSFDDVNIFTISKWCENWLKMIIIESKICTKWNKIRTISIH